MFWASRKGREAGGKDLGLRPASFPPASRPFRSTQNTFVRPSSVSLLHLPCSSRDLLLTVGEADEGRWWGVRFSQTLAFLSEPTSLLRLPPVLSSIIYTFLNNVSFILLMSHLKYVCPTGLSSLTPPPPT